MATRPEFVALREDDNCCAAGHLVFQTLLISHHTVTLQETLELMINTPSQIYGPSHPQNYMRCLVIEQMLYGIWRHLS